MYPSLSVLRNLLTALCFLPILAASFLPQLNVYNFAFQRADPISVVNNAGYKGITVAFPAEISVNEAKTLISNAQIVFREASAALHRATGQLASFAEVSFLIPRSWRVANFPSWDIFNPPVTLEYATREMYENAAFRVVSSDQEFAENRAQPRPMSVQYGGCARKGKYIFLPKHYFINVPTDAGARAIHVRRLVKEWARYRYGVFEERGYNNNPSHPLYYSTPGLEDSPILLNSCTNAKLVVKQLNYDSNDQSECQPSTDRTTGLPSNDSCYLKPMLFPSTDNDHINSSVMFSPSLNKAAFFCGTDSSIQHNSITPTRQNALCEGKSVMEVIRQSPDFKFADTSATPPNLSFKYLQEPEFQFAVALDFGFHMKESALKVKSALRILFREDMPDNTMAYVGSFTSSSSVRFFKENVTNDNREALINKIPDPEDTDQGNSCLLCALESLKQVTNDYPLMVAAVTNAKMNDVMAGKITDFLSQSSRMKLHLIVFDSDVRIDLQLQNAILSNGGNIIPIKNSESPLTIISLLEAFQSVLGKYSMRNEIASNIVSGDQINVIHSVPFSMSQLKRVKQLTVCLYESPTSTPSVPKDSIELLLGDQKYNYQSDDINFFDVEDRQFTAFCFKCAKEKLAENNELNFTVRSRTQEVIVKVWTIVEPETLLNPELVSEKINLNSWTEWLNKGQDAPNAMLIYAELRQGTRPIRGAKLLARIKESSLEQTKEESYYELELRDNGAGDPDVIREDGIYSRYFTGFKNQGGYVVSVYATGFNAEVLEKFPTEDFSKTGPTWKPVANFSAANPIAGTFQVNWDPTTQEDKFPPNRVTDLRVTEAVSRSVVLKWTAPGNDYDSGTAKSYIFKYFSTVTDARQRFEETGTEITVWEMHGKPLVPKTSGDDQDVHVELPKLDEGGLLYFAMMGIDAANNSSPVSNAVAVYLTKFSDLPVPTIVPNSTEEGNRTSAGHTLSKSEIGLIVGCVLMGVILIFVIVLVVFYVRRKRNKKAEELARDRNTPIVVIPTMNAEDPKPKLLSKAQLYETDRGLSYVHLPNEMEVVDQARLSMANGAGPIHAWPAEMLLSHYDRVQEAKQKNQPRPILNVGDLLESLSESNSSVASVPILNQNGTSSRYKAGPENGTLQSVRPSSQLSSHSKQVTQV